MGHYPTSRERRKVHTWSVCMTQSLNTSSNPKNIKCKSLEIATCTPHQSFSFQMRNQHPPSSLSCQSPLTLAVSSSNCTDRVASAPWKRQRCFSYLSQHLKKCERILLVPPWLGCTGKFSCLIKSNSAYFMPASLQLNLLEKNTQLCQLISS